MAKAPTPSLVFAADWVHVPGGGADAFADAVLVQNGRVVAVGSRAALFPVADARYVFDGATITPGLTDAHVHLLEWALGRHRVGLHDARTADDVLAAVSAGTTGAGGWLLGHGWSRHRLSDAPHRRVLDAAVGDRPVVLSSEDMHAVWVNTVALERAGIGEGTADPPGGRIERDASGSPTGVLLDNAMPLVLDRVPAPSAAERRRALLEGQAVLHRAGITGVHTVEPDTLGPLDGLRAGGDLRLRVLQHLPLAKLDDAIRLGVRSGFGDEWLRIGGIKMFLDGSLGSLTARMLQPYEGTDDRGVDTLPEVDFREAVDRAAAAGLAATVHAIGDAAVARALDVLAGTEPPPAMPHRIEHVQLLPPGRAADAGRAGIVCSVQPSHILADWAAADRHWGDRSERAYAFRSLLDGGAVLAFGSDMPAGPMDPRLTFLAATARQTAGGEPAGGWYAGERVSPREALEAYTGGPARAAHRPDLGQLAPGALADLAVWDRDPLELSGREFMELRCRATVVGGELVWSEEV